MMDDTVYVVLDFLRKNRFKKAEAALRTELGIHSYCDDSLEDKLSKQKKEVRLETKPTCSSKKQDVGTQINDFSQEFIDKNIHAGRTKKETIKSDPYPWSSNPIYSDINSNDTGAITNSLSELMVAEQLKHFPKRNFIGVKPNLSSNQSNICNVSKKRRNFEGVLSQNSFSIIWKWCIHELR